MVVRPDLPDHWKVRRLKQLSKRPEVVEWLIRLWAHCQQRGEGCFGLEHRADVAHVCGYEGDPDEFVGWLLDVRLLDENDGALVVHDWAEHNKGLLSARLNGRKGGRPKTMPAGYRPFEAGKEEPHE